MDFVIEVSARHVHLCQEDLQKLFGKDAALTPQRPLSQPGQYLSEERVDVVGPKGTFSNVAILGPVRSQTQVEVSLTDCRHLGVEAPVRESGDIAGSAPITIKGPTGQISLNKGLIAAKRHIHMTPEDATRFQVNDKDIVTVEVPSARKLYFSDVVVRVSPSYSLAMHIDTDEANAAAIGRTEIRGALVRIG